MNDVRIAPKDLARGVVKILGEFVMSTMDNNEDLGTVTKYSYLPKHSLTIIAREPRFMYSGNESPHEVSTQLIVTRTSATVSCSI